MPVHVDREPWTEIRKAVVAASGRVTAAIGYIGKDAHQLLPLKAGDVLVCDASDVTVKSGATNPRYLTPFLDAKVQVWSEEGLHAKVVVLPRRAFVGSANASDHSATALVEAVHETTDTDDIRQLREFVLARGDHELTKADVARLTTLMPKRRPRQPVARRAAALPDRVERLVVVGVSHDEWSRSEERLHDRDEAEGVSRARRVGTGVRLDAVALTPWVYGRIARDDWVVQYEDRRAHSPGVVVAMARNRDARMIWIARPKTRKMSITTRQAESAGIAKLDTIRVLSGAAAQRACEPFR